MLDPFSVIVGGVIVAAGRVVVSALYQHRQSAVQAPPPPPPPPSASHFNMKVFVTDMDSVITNSIPRAQQSLVSLKELQNVKLKHADTKTSETVAPPIKVNVAPICADYSTQKIKLKHVDTPVQGRLQRK